MSQDIRDFVDPSCDLLALGEPTHGEPAFPLIRNEFFAQLAGRGFRSIALETDRVAALTVNDFVQERVGTLDVTMREGFSHGFGELNPNRQLVAWMREYNERVPAAERLAFHGFDAPTEIMSAPSPRRYLEYARDYLKLDVDFASLVGDDDQWSRTEAILDPAESVGATTEAGELRSIADGMLTTLYVRAEERIAATSRAEWYRAKTYLTAGLGLLRYHQQSAERIDDQNERIAGLGAVRVAIMAQNLLDIRAIEARRGATLVFAHNGHLQRGTGRSEIGSFGAGGMVESILARHYTFVAGSIGRSEALGLRDPEPDTYEGSLQNRSDSWGLTPAAAVPAGHARTDVDPTRGYFPLDRAMLDLADAVLHINAA